MLQVRRGKGVVNSHSAPQELARFRGCTPPCLVPLAGSRRSCNPRVRCPRPVVVLTPTPRHDRAALGTMAEGWHVAEWLWNVWPRVTHALDSITPTSAFAYFIALVWCLAVSRAFAFFKQATRARRV